MQKILTSLFILALATTSFGQRSSFYKQDVGFNLGLSNYLGEIGGKEKTEQPFVWDMKLNQTRWAVGGFYRYKFNDFAAARVDLIYGRIQGADSLSENPGRVGRNLSFRNDIVELSARGEVYLFNMVDVGGRGWYKVDFKSYAFAGIGAAYHEPKTLYNGSWQKLRPLKTEGVEYKNIIPVVPLGLGVYFTYKRKHRFGWEMGWRMTFTDYIDDISTVYADPSTLESDMAIDLANRRDELGDRPDVPHASNYEPPSENNAGKRGDASDNDTYFFTVFSYSYVIRGSNPYYSQHYNWLGGRGGKQRVRVKF